MTSASSSHSKNTFWNELQDLPAAESLCQLPLLSVESCLGDVVLLLKPLLPDIELVGESHQLKFDGEGDMHADKLDLDLAVEAPFM